MANVKRNQLNTRKVKSLSEPGTYTDGAGLTLRLQPTGSKSWVLRLTVEEKRRNYGLGGYPDVSLAEARAQARAMRSRARQGLDPVVNEAPRIPQFTEAAETVIGLRPPTWSSPRHAVQWSESLRLHALPVLGKKPVDKITTADVLTVLQPIWTSKPETAGRVRQRIAVVFDFCIAAGWRHDNPCNGALKAALPRRNRVKRHHPALPYAELPDALLSLRAAPGRDSTRLGLEFVILTAAHAGEVRGAQWDEMDLEAGIWTVPAERMKMRRPHRVPLSTGALAVLKEAREFSDRGLIFPSNRNPGKPLSNMAFTMMLRRAGYGDSTVHGMRATFRTWALEQTDTPWAVAEAALAHSLGGQEVQAYARSDLFERRLELMQEWSDYVFGTG